MPKQPNFFHSQCSTLPKDAPAKFYLCTTFGLRFMLSSVAPTRSSTFYAYLSPNSETITLKYKLKEVKMSTKIPPLAVKFLFNLLYNV